MAQYATTNINWETDVYVKCIIQFFRPEKKERKKRQSGDVMCIGVFEK